jgi:uncharacterized DUF497 family protein
VVITWDERKRVSNRDKHGLDFADLTLEFFSEAIVKTAKLGRSTAVGKLKDMTIVVVFSFMGREALSVISMRLANKRERAYVA